MSKPEHRKMHEFYENTAIVVFHITSIAAVGLQRFLQALSDSVQSEGRNLNSLSKNRVLRKANPLGWPQRILRVSPKDP
jgi:hypothetical protein